MEARQGRRDQRDEPLTAHRAAHLKARAAFVQAALKNSGSTSTLVNRANLMDAI